MVPKQSARFKNKPVTTSILFTETRLAIYEQLLQVDGGDRWGLLLEKSCVTFLRSDRSRVSALKMESLSGNIRPWELTCHMRLMSNAATRHTSHVLYFDF